MGLLFPHSKTEQDSSAKFDILWSEMSKLLICLSQIRLCNQPSALFDENMTCACLLSFFTKVQDTQDMDDGHIKEERVVESL